jgi:hypothetical protein
MLTLKKQVQYVHIGDVLVLYFKVNDHDHIIIHGCHIRNTKESTANDILI